MGINASKIDFKRILECGVCVSKDGFLLNRAVRPLCVFGIAMFFKEKRNRETEAKTPSFMVEM
ncbi:hypothetical protein [Helicobacter felis]|uniref:hypothetical protein n=1 Tax=Helicobacter felis TaxID=214 RepID=UPI000CEEB1B6|nr:hypothetical protein [Helicobacter felis]